MRYPQDSSKTALELDASTINFGGKEIHGISYHYNPDFHSQEAPKSQEDAQSSTPNIDALLPQQQQQRQPQQPIQNPNLTTSPQEEQISPHHIFPRPSSEESTTQQPSSSSSSSRSVTYIAIRRGNHNVRNCIFASWEDAKEVLLHPDAAYELFHDLASAALYAFGPPVEEEDE